MPETENDASEVAKSSTGAPRAAASLGPGTSFEGIVAFGACGEAAADRLAAGSV